MFLALLLEERGEGDLAEVARRIHAKLVRRHPHVFETPGELDTPGAVKQPLGDAEVRAGEPGRDLPRRSRDAAGAAAREEGATPGSDGRLRLRRMPCTPSRTSRTSSRSCATRTTRCPETEPDPTSGRELGDLLFACVNVSRRLNVDPELALRQATGRFVSRVERAEELAAADGREWVALPVGDQDAISTAPRRSERG